MVTLVAGILDIASAIGFTVMAGNSPMRMLAAIATGPLGDDVRERAWAPAAGLAVHFAIMAAMVCAYALAAARQPQLLSRLGPIAAGIGYGLLLYLVMYWLVLPLRWPTLHPQTEFVAVAKALFAHTICVGLPIAFLLSPRVAVPAAKGACLVSGAFELESGPGSARSTRGK